MPQIILIKKKSSVIVSIVVDHFHIIVPDKTYFYIIKTERMFFLLNVYSIIINKLDKKKYLIVIERLYSIYVHYNYFYIVS